MRELKYLIDKKTEVDAKINFRKNMGQPYNDLIEESKILASIIRKIELIIKAVNDD